MKVEASRLRNDQATRAELVVVENHELIKYEKASQPRNHQHARRHQRHASRFPSPSIKEVAHDFRLRFFVLMLTDSLWLRGAGLQVYRFLGDTLEDTAGSSSTAIL